ncbi:uncharacterized protein LOC135495120 [Lineus longissimus]|uniref:uncharacterized protein LOC135495120 n=1 Tax=Lineus longissimus TaxID=88925 RepID=UPI00315D342F
METHNKKIIIYFAIFSIIVGQVEPNLCKYRRFFGQTNAEIVELGDTNIHGLDSLVVLWGSAFTIDSSGYLIGWYYHQTKISSLFLDVWEVTPAASKSGLPDTFILKRKQGFNTTVPGDNTQYISYKVKVHPGYVLGVHNAPGKKLFIPVRHFIPDTDVECTIVDGINDASLASLGNSIAKVRWAEEGRIEAFGAHVLVHDFSDACVQAFVLSPITTFNAFEYSRYYDVDSEDCSLYCLQKSTRCMNFSYKELGGECRLFSVMLPANHGHLKITMDASEELYIAEE